MQAAIFMPRVWLLCVTMSQGSNLAALTLLCNVGAYDTYTMDTNLTSHPIKVAFRHCAHAAEQHVVSLTIDQPIAMAQSAPCSAAAPACVL